WELAALTRRPVRLRTVAVSTATPRVGWRGPAATDVDGLGGWTQPTLALPVMAIGESVPREAIDGAGPVLRPLAARRLGQRRQRGRHAAGSRSRGDRR